jgi:hypothetical protein
VVSPGPHRFQAHLDRLAKAVRSSRIAAERRALEQCESQGALVLASGRMAGSGAGVGAGSGGSHGKAAPSASTTAATVQDDIAVQVGGGDSVTLVSIRCGTVGIEHVRCCCF